MVEVSYLAAFFGGVLSLLSPCSALLLPAFFAYAFQSRRKLLAKTSIFYLGLATTLVPLLGMGIAAVSRLVYGFAGFCSGPILGAVLTVAASSGEVVRGAGLLAAYALGMAAPLFLLATLWDRFDLGHRRWLRGREVSLGPLRFHTTSLLSGLMFVVVGVLFITFEGTSGLEGLYASGGATDLAFSAERWAETLSEGVPALIALAVVGLLSAALLVYRTARRRNEKPAKRGN